MRILFVSNEYPPVTDGIGAYVASVAPALATAGHDVHVLSCDRGHERSDRLEAGVHVHRRPLLALRGLRRVVRGHAVRERALAALSAAVHRRPLGAFDVVEVADWLAEGLVLGRTEPTPIVGHLHTPIGLVHRQSDLPIDRDVRAADAMERVALRRARLLTAPSELIVERLRADGWLADRPQPIRVVRYPVDLERWAGVAPVADTAPVVMAVGRLERRKAPELLIDACARLAEHDVRLVLVGRSAERRDGLPYGDWLAARAEAAGVSCEIVDHVARHELADLYERARVVAVPSRFDNFPMVGLEAMACARPVVCSDRTGTAELVAGTDAGAVVPAGDSAALAAALLPHVAAPATAAQAGAAARALVTRACAPATIAARRVDVYRAAIG